MGIHWLPFLGVVAAAYLVPAPDLAVIVRVSRGVLSRLPPPRPGLWRAITGGVFVAIGAGMAVSA